jgi:hypothetical protein
VASKKRRTVSKTSEFSPLTASEFEAFRDTLVIIARRLSEEQMLELSDNFHTLLRRRSLKNWNEAKQGTAGFD